MSSYTGTANQPDRAKAIAAVVAVHVGLAAIVTRTFWVEGGGGQPSGWVCELDLPAGVDPRTATPRFVCIWESLLTPITTSEPEDER